MLSCLVPNWVWKLFDWLDDRELTIALNWLVEKSIIVCNEVI